MKRRVQEMPQYSQPSMAVSSLLYSALGSPRDLSGRSKTFSQGLFWLPRWLSFLFTEQRCWGGRGSPFLLLAGVSLLFPLSPELHSAQLFSSPTPPPRPSIPPPAPDEQDPNSGLSLEIILQLHWQKTSVFDDISSRDEDLAGSQVLSLGGDFIPSWRLQGRFVLKMLTLLCPPISPWGLWESINKPPPSPPLPGASRHSWCSCSHDLLGKRKQEHNVLSPSSSPRPVASPMHELVLAKMWEGQMAESTEPDFCRSQEIGINYKYVPSALQYYRWSAMPSQTTERFAEKKKKPKTSR